MIFLSICLKIFGILKTSVYFLQEISDIWNKKNQIFIKE